MVDLGAGARGPSGMFETVCVGTERKKQETPAKLKGRAVHWPNELLSRLQHYVHKRMSSYHPS